MAQANNSAFMKENNKRQIVNLIRKSPCSRADIARATGLSRAAVTILTDSLLEDGVIVKGETVKSDSGRRPTLLHLNPQAFVSVGIDLCREGCGLLLTDFSGRGIWEKRMEFLATADQTIDAACAEIHAALADMGTNATVLGACVCCPGPIDTEAGMILNPSGLALFHDYNIKNALSSRLSLPIFLEKDTNALAVAEKNAGDLHGDLLFLLADHGIGCAVIKDDRLFFGRDGMGGELGHTTIDVNGPVCPCGNVGCAELYASIPATLLRSGESSWEQLTTKAKNGDLNALQTIREQGKILSALCVNAVNLFEPSNVVLGGKLSEAGFILEEMIETALTRSAFSRRVHKFRVFSSRLGQNARAYAAALIPIERYFNGGNVS